jgi:2-polyprenyl-3-methyl-5-hydroxy-6-metoxy-1,4-benzoquinol methylase
MQVRTEPVATPPALYALKLEMRVNASDQLIRSNLDNAKNLRLSELSQVPARDGTLAIVGSGPSLKTTWGHIPPDCDVMALNGAYRFLLENGRTPKYFAMLDARAVNTNFLQHIEPQTQFLLASQCHPDVFERLPDATLFHLMTEATESVFPDADLYVGGGGTIGLTALGLAFALGYRKVILYGYDSSFSGEDRHAAHQAQNAAENAIDVWVQDRVYRTTHAMAAQVMDFFPFLDAIRKAAPEFDIQLIGNGLFYDFVATNNKPVTVEAEREKYEAMWKHDAYRKEAPGAAFVDDAFELLGMQSGESLTDYGSGTGRASFAFHEHKVMNVTAVDFADNAFEYATGPGYINFVHACLWDLPEIESDWAYCTDVMEHIPTEKVDAVIDGIAKRTRKGAYFNVATRPDNLGALIGRKLHMTVMPGIGWQTILSKYFAHVEMREREGEATFICKR